MNRSTKHHLAALALACIAFLIMAGSLRVWDIPLLSLLPSWVGILAFALFVFAVLSASRIGPWGRWMTRQTLEESAAYKASLQPKQPWQQ